MRKFYITTSIAYANAKPHLGFVLESVQADALARFERQKKRDARFLTGVDEHGLKIERAAKEAGKAPQDFVDEISGEFRELKNVFNLSWNDFIRTSDRQRHWPGALELFSRLKKSGDIYEKKYSGWYCVGCERFVTEKDLVDGHCPFHKKKPEFVEETNFFFRLSKYGEKIKREIEAGRLRIIPETRQNEILSFLKAGLEDISVSRPKATNPWGIPIPGSDQTLYVWCDALSNYISSLGFGSVDSVAKKNFRKWWPADAHLVGKDILRFHAVIWPAMLMSAKISFPKKILAHGFITADGEKMSKSSGNVIDPFELAGEYGGEAVRYYLLREIPSDEDGDFNREKFETRYNADLANGLGNFASRVSTLALPYTFPLKIKATAEVKRRSRETRKEVEIRLGRFKIHEAVAVIWDFLKFGDGYVNRNKPWENKDRRIIADLVYILSETADLIFPFLPETSEKIKSAFFREGNFRRLNKINQLFPRS
jgi:methionyl-tRNA synthetase